MPTTVTYLDVENGLPTQQRAATASAGTADAGKLVALGANGKLDQSMLPTGIGADVKILPASEALAAGDLVNVWVSAGAAKVRKADGSVPGKEAVGFVLSSVSAGGNATVYFEGTISGLTGLTPGANVFLSAATPGKATQTPPAAAGNVVQLIGKAISATEVSFEPAAPIKLA